MKHDDLIGVRTLGYFVNFISISLEKVINDEMKPYDLTKTQWLPIFLIACKNQDTPAQLAESCAVDTGAMTRTLDRLEAKKLITRQRSTSDKRVIKIKLTSHGEHLANHLIPVIREAMQSHLSGLSPTEQETLFDLLTKVALKGHPNMVARYLSVASQTQQEKPCK